MQSLRDRNKSKNTKTKIGASLAVLVILIVLAPIVFPSIGRGLRQVISPIWKLENNASSNSKSFFANLKAKRALDAENTILKNRVTELEAKLADHDVIANENLALKELLGRKGSEDLILGTVLIKPNRSVYDTLVIDAGSSVGVTSGALVYAYGVIPIGTITSVSAKTSTVTLFSTAGQITNSRIDGKNIDIELVGRGGGNFELKVPRDVSLEPDMEVLLPGLKPMVVAIVTKSITDARDPVQTFLLTSPVNINELNWVQIVK